MSFTVGQLLIREALPPDLRDQAAKLDKKGLSSLLSRLAREHPDDYRRVSHQLSQIGWRASQETGGFSFGLEDLIGYEETAKRRQKIRRELNAILSDPKLDDKTRNQRIVEAVAAHSKPQQDEIYEAARRSNNPLGLQVLSGARGNPANLASLLGSDLLYADQEGNPIPVPVLRSYSEGLTPAEFWAGTYGARRGVLATKMAVQNAGALGKVLNQVAHRLTVTDEDEDEDEAVADRPLRGLPVDVDDPDNEGALLAKDVGPYKRNTVITPKIARHIKQLGHDTVLIRSPISGALSRSGGLYARDVGVRETGRLPELGSFPGLAAAQALSEPLSQGQLCLAAGTLVRMADGSVKAIEQIQVGDRVIGSDVDGHTFPVRVVRIYDNGSRGCIRSQFDNGSELDSTPQHGILWRDDTDSRYVSAVGDTANTVAALAGYPETTKIVARRPLGELPTYDIEVDHPDHLFVLANGLIVSNSAKHSGGIVGEEKALSGFDYIEQLVQVPKTFKGGAAHAEVDGMVTRVEPAPAGGNYVWVGDQRHYVSSGYDVRVKRGDMIEAGDVLSDGAPNPAKIVEHKGIGEGRRYFATEMRRAMRESGMTSHRRNVELIARGLIDHVEMDDQFDSHLPGDIVPYSRLEQKWRPRPDAQQLELNSAKGMYLESPVAHYTVGTRIRPSVINQLRKLGIEQIRVHREPPPFHPRMIRGQDNLQHDPDWMTRMYGSGLKKGLLDAVHRGAVADEEGSSFVPSMARGVEFGKIGPSAHLSRPKPQPPASPPPTPRSSGNTWLSV